MEKESFEEIIKNASNIFISKYISKDSLKCINFIKENSFVNLDTNIVDPFIIKYLIEIVQKYQQILDQFIIKSTKKKKVDKFNNNSKYSKILYLIMYLFTNRKNDYINLLNLSFDNYNEVEKANMICQNIHNYDIEYISEWLNNEGNNFYNNLLYFLNEKEDNNIKYIFDDSDKNTIYSPFSSVTIQNELENNINYIYYYDVLFSLERHTYNDDYSLFLTTNYKLNNILKYYIANLLLLSVLTDNKDIVNCYFWKSTQKKKLPKNKVLLGANHVNSGSTLLSDNKNITIVRIEESLKVIIHECIHYLNLDLSQHDFYNTHKWLKKHFLINDNCKILINECYVEIWAVIINSIITSHVTNPSELLQTFLFIMNIEKLYSCFQCAKILKYYGFSNFSEFYNNKGWSSYELDKTKYNEKSSILSYYIIKSAVLFNINSFFELCYPDTYSIKNFIRFDEKSENKFLQLIINSLNNNKFKNIVNNYFEILDNDDLDDFIKRNLRMTAVSLFN